MIKNNIAVWEIRIKIYLLSDIKYPRMQQTITDFIDSAMVQDEQLSQFHKENKYKLYCFGGFWPLEKKGIYKKEQIYTVTIRTVDQELANYFVKVFRNHYTAAMKGLSSEIKKVPQKVLGEIYTLTPAIVKSEQGYWRNNMNLTQFEKRLFENAVKKYNQFTGKQLDENFQLYTNITFINENPIANEYKKIHLLGDKINLKIADNAAAQELAYFMLGTGMLEMNSRGYGYCNFRWI